MTQNTQGPNKNTGESDLMEQIVNLCKRRGLVFASSDIYGGFRSTWDFGPVGVLLKRNVKEAWFKSMVQMRDKLLELMHQSLWLPKFGKLRVI